MPMAELRSCSLVAAEYRVKMETPIRHDEAVTGLKSRGSR